MILITLTMGELVSAFPMSELACTSLRSSPSFMSWHAALPAYLLNQRACCNHSCHFLSRPAVLRFIHGICTSPWP